MLCGRVWALPATVAVATFVAQTHVQYVALTAPLVALGAIALVLSAVRGRRSGGPPTLRQLGIAGAVSAGLLLILWLPPLLEQLSNNPGNMTRIVRWFRDSGHEAHTLGDGLRVVGAQFALAPEWLTTHRRPLAFTGESAFLLHAPRPWLALLFAAAVYVCWRRRDRVALRLAVVVAVAGISGVIALARVEGPMYDYRLQWIWLIAMSAMVLVAWTAWKELARRYPVGSARALVPVALGALLVVNTANIVSVFRTGDPQAPVAGIVGDLTAESARALPPGDGEIVVEPGEVFLTSALLLDFDRRGMPVRVATPDMAWGYLGDAGRRVHKDGPVRARVRVVTDDDVDRLLHRPGVRLLSYWGTLPVDEREAVSAGMHRRIDEIAAAHDAGRISDEQALLETADAALVIPARPGVAYKAIGVFLMPD
jgi:hypothetical protein